jgi:ABC-type bacteriocin/lantibiotic exporter with double-glycine peptidase domain
MFKFSPFSTPSRQRLAVLAAETFAPIPLHPAVERQLQLAGRIDVGETTTIGSKWMLFWEVLRGLRELVRDLVLWTVVNSLIVLAAVLITREVFRATSSLQTGLSLAGVFLVLRVIQACVEYRNATRRLQVHRGVQVSLYRIINEKLARLAPAGRAEFSKGQLKTLVGSDVESIEDFISAALMQWTPVTVSTLVVIPALWYLSGWPGLVALLVALALLPVAALGAAIVEHFQKQAQAEQDKLTTSIGEWVKNIRLVRFLGWDNAIEKEVDRAMWRYMVRAALRHTAVLVVWAISYSWSMLPLLTIFALSLTMTSPLNLVEVFSSFWLLDHLMTQLQYIPHSLSMYGSASAGATRVIHLLEQPELEDSLLPASSQTISPSAHPTKLILSDVSVRFGAHTVLARVSLTLALNERIGIIGFVGSGKTTLLQVIIGELPVSAGSVEVEFSDGTRAPLWRTDVYSRFRSAIAYSPQQPFLSNASMRENIDLSGAALPDDVDVAVALAQLNDDIALFPRGLAEEVGESGINLSGGQKQRVSLARAFISRRSLFIFDDPLSSVDTLTEHRLMDAMISRSAGFILVSHRLSVLQRCDRVIVLEGGCVVEDGHPVALAANPSSRVARFLEALEKHEH